MHFVWKLVFFIYNLVLIALGTVVTMLAVGYHDYLTDFVALASYSDQNRMAALTIGIGLMVIALLMILLACFKRKKKVITVKTDAGHKITISIKAAQTMVLQSLLGVPGIREVTPEILGSGRGITVRLHVTVEARQNVPDLCKEMQQRVKDHLTNVSGLNVVDVTLLVENVVPVSKSRAASKKDQEAAEPKKPLFAGKKKEEKAEAIEEAAAAEAAPAAEAPSVIEVPPVTEAPIVEETAAELPVEKQEEAQMPEEEPELPVEEKAEAAEEAAAEETKAEKTDAK